MPRIRLATQAALICAILAVSMFSLVLQLPAPLMAALSLLPLALGAVVTSDFLDALFKNFQAIYQRGFLAAEQMADYGRLATRVPSTTEVESYNWLGEVPKMQEWLDERGLKGLHAFEYSLKNKDWEATIEVHRNTLEDDKLDHITPRVNQLAMEPPRHKMELIAQALIDGSDAVKGKGFDGVAFFATTHAFGDSGTQSNLLTGTGTTQAQLKADFKSARAAMRKFKDARGRQMNLVGDVLVVPPDLEIDFRELFSTQAVSETARALVGLVAPSDIIVAPELTDTNDYYLFATRQIKQLSADAQPQVKELPLKPFILQVRKEAEFQEDRAQLFTRKRLFYGVDARYVVGYGFWFLGVKVTNV